MESNTIRNNYPWIDVAKSIAIFLVVWGHFQNYGTFLGLQKLIYSFHIPLFLILSGFLYTYKEGEPLGSFVRKKFVRTAFPALLWLLISQPLFIWFHRGESPFVILRAYAAKIYKGAVPINEPCWFFIVLFFIFVVVRLIRIDKYSNVINGAIAMTAFSLGYLLVCLNISDYFMIVKTVVSLGFFMAGYLVRNSRPLSGLQKNKSLRLLIILASFLLWILSALFLNDKVSLYCADFGNYWIFILSALSGTFVLCETSRFICEKNKSKEKSLLESYPVKSSPFIICSHYLAFIMFALAMREADLLSTWQYNLIFGIFVVLLFIAYYPLSKFVSRYAPLLNGENKKE